MQSWDNLYSPVTVVREAARAEAKEENANFVVGSIARGIKSGTFATRDEAEAFAASSITTAKQVYTRDEWNRNHWLRD